MKIVNLTPHNITYRDADGADHTYPSEGIARVTSTSAATEADEFPFPLQTTSFGSPEGLPQPADGVCYIVSGLVLQSVGGRFDVVAPATGPNDGVIRNEKGHVVAVTRFNRNL